MKENTASGPDAPKGPDMELVAGIVSAYVGYNTIATSDLPGLIASVHATLASVGAPEPEAPPLEPAVPIRRSVTPDHIICLEDGLRFRSMKRHLQTHHGLTPDEYREKWGLPANYPMVAPSYAEARSQLARDLGLGQKRRRRSA